MGVEIEKAFVRSVTTAGMPPGRWRAMQGMPLPRSAFQPRPKVDSCVLVLARG